MTLSFQDLILRLHEFWVAHGCLIWQPHNQMVGAGTMNPATYLRALGPEPWNVAYIEPSVRPDDGRFGENPNRLYTHTQYQVILKPTPERSQELYLESLSAIGVDLARHDVRFVEDNWAQPAIGAWGLGWEVWLDGLEITQYTYFQQVGGVTLDPIPLEITYGLERIAMALQGVRSVFDLQWDAVRSYGDVRFQDEVERSKYAFEHADVEALHAQFDLMERECKRTIGSGLVLPAHDMVLQMSNIFNLLDTRGAVGVTERQRFLGRTRDLAKEVAKAYVKQREELGHPWMKKPHAVKWVVEEVKASGIENAKAGLSSEILLLEIGVEELPAHCVADAKAQLEKHAPELLKENRIKHGAIKVLATPRRLAVLVDGVAAEQDSIEENVKGPGAKIAFDKEGNPTQAGQAFAKRFGLEARDLQVIDDGKTAYVYARRFEEGRATHEILGELCKALVTKLQFEKTMRWNASNLAFSRPLQWFVALLGSRAISFEVAGIASGRISTGVRGRGSPRFEVKSAGEYETLLREQHIIGDINARKAEVLRQVKAVAAGIGAVVEEDDDLLEEVANLVEEPSALLCAFEPEFLHIPPIILTKTMRSKQRYFTLNDARTGEMRPNFITVRNGPAQDAALVVAGNEDVIRARFADASYFYKRDVKKPLDSLVPRLETLTFQAKLGSMLDKTKRIESLVEPVYAQLTGLASGTGDSLVLAIAKKAAGLCKADLVSNMVIEMTSLQGAMGRDYLLKQGSDPAVADAVAEHYHPRFSGDRVPRSEAGMVVSIADRLDSIAGLFAVGLAPKGSADPFALRRAAIGIVQTLVERKKPFSLMAGLKAAAMCLPVQMSTDNLEAAHRFIVDRQRAGMIEAGHRHDVIEAVLAVLADDPSLAQVQVEQLQRAVSGADWPQLLAAYSRCGRIAKGFDDKGEAAHDSDPASVQLATAVGAIRKPENVDDLVVALRALRPSIDAFFDKVLINADDMTVRRARLGLVSRVHRLADGVCDVGRVEGY